jgi:hypothetical protein
MLQPSISRREWRNVVLFALAVMTITTIPYLIGVAQQRVDRRFGWFMFGLFDGNSYLAKMRQGAVDGWLFHIVYTPEPHDGTVLFTPYLAAGKLASLIAQPSSPTFVDAMQLVFHASRILFGFVLVLVIYRFVAVFLVKRSLRWLALILITLGGGFGWLLNMVGLGGMFGSIPVDLTLPEGYTVFLLYGLPHLALARAALFGGLLLTFKALNKMLIREWLLLMVLAGLLWLIMGLCVPFYIAVLFAILGVWGLATLIRYRQFPMGMFIRFAVGATIPLPYLVYNLTVFGKNPVLAQWSVQNALPSPHPLHYMFGYGLLAVLAIPAFKWAWQRGKHRPAYLLLPAWVSAAPIMAYLPIAVQRRLLEGFFVPLCIMAVMGLRLWWMNSGIRTRPRRARLIWRYTTIGLVLFLLPSTLIILLSGIPALSRTESANRLFHSNAEIEALDWLNVNAEPNSVILSSLETGNYIPARASLRTFLGHSPETLYLDDKLKLADAFWSGKTSADEIEQFFRDYAIRFVIYDPGVEPIKSDQLTLKFRSGDYLIYEVVKR